MYNNEDGEYLSNDRAFNEEASLVTKNLDVHSSDENGKASAIESCTDKTNESDHQDRQETKKNVDISPASKLSFLKHSPWKFLLDPLA